MMIDEETLKNVKISRAYQRSFSIQLAERKNILMTVDGLLVAASLLVGLWFGAQKSGWIFSWQLLLIYSPWFVGLLTLYFILATANDAYLPKTASDPAATLVALIKTSVQIFVVYFLIYALLPPWSLPRHFVGIFILLSPVLIFLWRYVYSWAFSMPVFQHRAIIVGAGWAGETIAKTLKDFAPSHFHILGFVDDDLKTRQVIQGFPVLGATTGLPNLVQSEQATDVVLAITRDIPGHVLASLMNCYERNVRLSTMPELYERLTYRVPVEHIGDNWFVSLPLINKGQNLTYSILKRLMDTTIAAIGLIVFIPLLPLLAVLIAADSPGPIFYRQKRVGRSGREFDLIKLRSMVVDAEGDGVARWAEAGDKRVTRVGRFLRQTRLDEVPQLLNVLRGEMSLIGPRPERPEFVCQLEQEIPFYRTRLTVKPGLTGWAQVNYDYGRSKVDALEKLRYDLYYIKHQSIQLDLVILLKTASTILLLKGV